MLFVVDYTAGDRNSVSWKLKHNVIEGITELLQDIDNYHSQVAEQAIEHIHQKYVKICLLGSLFVFNDIYEYSSFLQLFLERKVFAFFYSHMSEY